MSSIRAPGSVDICMLMIKLKRDCLSQLHTAAMLSTGGPVDYVFHHSQNKPDSIEFQEDDR